MSNPKLNIGVRTPDTDHSFDTDPIETSVLALYIPPAKEHTLYLDEH